MLTMCRLLSTSRSLFNWAHAQQLTVFNFTGNLVRESFAPREDYPKLSADAKHLKDVTSKLVNLRLDHTEFTCLKALALFKPDVCGLRNHVQVEVLQDQTHLMLQEYCNSKAQLSAGKLRFGKILLTMPIISQVILFGTMEFEVPKVPRGSKGTFYRIWFFRSI